jgi:tetratricopeptide (TPR) repeat protein
MVLLGGLLGGCAEAPDDATLARKGIEAVEYFDFNTGLRLLRQVQPTWPVDDPLWLELTYALALSAWHASPPQADWITLSEQLFSDIAGREEDRPIGALSRMNLARLAEIVDYPGDTPDFDKARAIYEDLRERFPESDIGMQATLRLASLMAFDRTPESTREAIRLMKEQLTRHAGSPWTSVAWQFIGDLYYSHLHDMEASLAAYEQAYALGFANVPRTDSYLWRMGQFAERLGLPGEARIWYQRIIEDHPRSIYGTWAEMAVDQP